MNHPRSLTLTLFVLVACSDPACPPGRSKVANNCMLVPADTGVDASTTDESACTGDESCTRANASRCDEGSDTCSPCKVSRECQDIAGKSACIKDVGCFECSDDNNTCKAPNALCHPTRHECVACTAANTAACEADGKVCEPQSGACVACLANAQCTDASKAKCEPGKNECGKCAVNDDCKHLADTPYCDATAGKCVACTSNAECKDPKASRCDLGTNTCVGCAAPTDCVGVIDPVSKDTLPLCVSQECVHAHRTGAVRE